MTRILQSLLATTELTRHTISSIIYKKRVVNGNLLIDNPDRDFFVLFMLTSNMVNLPLYEKAWESVLAPDVLVGDVKS